MDQPFDIEKLIASVDRPDREALDLLTDAVMVSGRLDEMADQLVDHFVQNARRSGASWADIGQAIGVSKQAAQKRFVRRGPRLRGPGRGLFTRFAEHARSVVEKAVEYAHTLGSSEIGTLHLLVALTEPDGGRAGEALEGVGEDLEMIHGAARAALGEPSSGAPTSGHIPFATESKKVLELSLREAIRDESRQIGTEHILLGILRDPDSAGAHLLDEHGVSAGTIRTWLVEHPAD